MAELTIIHRIDAPELAAAINHFAKALTAYTGAVFPLTPCTDTAPGAAFSEAAPAPVTAAPAVPASPAAPTNPAPVAPTNPAPVAPTNPAPVAPTNPAPVAPAASTPEKAYTFEDITSAGSQLLEMNKMEQLMELLKQFGVQAVTQLKADQYADVAKGLRSLGAKI